VGGRVRNFLGHSINVLSLSGLCPIATLVYKGKPEDYFADKKIHAKKGQIIIHDAVFESTSDVDYSPFQDKLRVSEDNAHKLLKSIDRISVINDQIIETKGEEPSTTISNPQSKFVGAVNSFGSGVAKTVRTGLNLLGGFMGK
jgi:hypothetical protein